MQKLLLVVVPSSSSLLTLGKKEEEDEKNDCVGVVGKKNNDNAGTKNDDDDSGRRRVVAGTTFGVVVERGPHGDDDDDAEFSFQSSTPDATPTDGIVVVDGKRRRTPPPPPTTTTPERTARSRGVSIDGHGKSKLGAVFVRRAGKSIGNRLIEEYLAKTMNSGGMGNTNTNRNSVADSCKTFREVMENVAFVGFRMFLNARCRLVDWSSSSSSSSTNSNSTGTATLSNSQNSNTATNTTTTNNNNNNMSENNSVTLAIDDLSLADFVELPEKYANSLSYCEIVCGVVEGALESVNARVKVQFCKDGLRNDLSSSYVGQTHESDRIVKNCKFALRVTSLGPIEDEPYPFKDDD